MDVPSTDTNVNIRHSSISDFVLIIHGFSVKNQEEGVIMSVRKAQTQLIESQKQPVQGLVSATPKGQYLPTAHTKPQSNLTIASTTHWSSTNTPPGAPHG